MSALAFLGIALLISLLGCVALWLRVRKPSSMDSHIRDFARELDALAPGRGEAVVRRRGRGGGPTRNGGSGPG